MKKQTAKGVPITAKRVAEQGTPDPRPTSLSERDSVSQRGTLSHTEGLSLFQRGTLTLIHTQTYTHTHTHTHTITAKRLAEQGTWQFS